VGGSVGFFKTVEEMERALARVERNRDALLLDLVKRSGWGMTPAEFLAHLHREYCDAGMSMDEALCSFDHFCPEGE
jgi:hypothetical protein